MTSHLVGGNEWMQSLGFGPLDTEADDGAPQTTGGDGSASAAQPAASQDDDAHAGAPAGTAHSAPVPAAICQNCGQIVFSLGLGPCACEQVGEAHDASN